MILDINMVGILINENVPGDLLNVCTDFACGLEVLRIKIQDQG